MSALGLAQLSVLENLTIANGWASSPEGYDAYGGGLYVNDSPLLVRNCRFVGNRAEASGGAVSLMLTQSQFLDCYFVGNTATRVGAAWTAPCRPRPPSATPNSRPTRRDTAEPSPVAATAIPWWRDACSAATRRVVNSTWEAPSWSSWTATRR